MIRCLHHWHWKLSSLCYLVTSRCQPIVIRNVINYLHLCLLNEKTLNKTFGIGGPDVLIARQLVQSMKTDVICKEDSIRTIIPQELIPYREAIQMAFLKIEQNMVISSWTDAASSSLSRLDVDQICGCAGSRLLYGPPMD